MESKKKEAFRLKNFRLKTIDKTRNYFFEEIKHNELIREKHKKA